MAKPLASSRMGPWQKSENLVLGPQKKLLMTMLECNSKPTTAAEPEVSKNAKQ